MHVAMLITTDRENVDSAYSDFDIVLFFIR